MYNDPSCKPWTSRSWAPAGYTSRYDLVAQDKAAQANKPLANAVMAEKQPERGDLNGSIGNGHGHEANGTHASTDTA